jgi:hypothetical protein
MGLGGRLALAVLTLTLMPAASARATVVTLGPAELAGPNEGGFACQAGCPEGFTIAQQLPAVGNVAPASGVVTSWALVSRHAPVSPNVWLAVVEPGPAGTWHSVLTSSPATDYAGAGNKTELPIEAGDLIGAVLGPGAEIEAPPAPPGTQIFEWKPPLGEEPRVPAFVIPGGMLELNAQVELTPVITSVAPASGTAAGGNTVTITGKYFDGAVNVLFGRTAATHFTVDLEGEHITATAPASSAGTVDVLVSALHSTSEPVAADRYTFVASAGPPSGGPGPGPAGSTGVPVVSGFSESASRWRLGSSLPHIASTPVGTTFSFRLNEAGNIALSFIRTLPGRRAGKSCVAPNAKNRSHAKCKRTVGAGTLPVAAHAGLNKVGFQGRLSKTKKLSPGAYGVSITIRGSHGSRSLTKPLSFTIVR